MSGNSFFRGLVFDFNGVLLWDKHINDHAWQQTALKIRGRELSEDEMVRWVYGRPNRDTFEWFLGRKLSHPEMLELIEGKETIYRTKCKQDPAFHLSPGAVELFEFLIENRIPHTIATSSEKTNVDFFIRELELGRWFDLDKIVYDDFTFPGKPAPDMYLRAAQKLDIEPRLLMAVEDSISGLEAAAAAGYGKVIGLGPREKHQKLLAVPGVGAAIESLESFPRGELKRVS